MKIIKTTAVIKMDLIVSAGMLCPLAIANNQKNKSASSSKQKTIIEIRLTTFIFKTQKLTVCRFVNYCLRRPVNHNQQ